MRYVRAKLKREQKDQAYRIYITDSIYAEQNNMRMALRYKDIINPTPQDNRSGDEIALEVIKNAGLKVIDDGLI